MFYTDDHNFLDVFIAVLRFLFEEKIEAGLDDLVEDLDPGLAVAGVNDVEDTEVPLRQLQLPPHQGQGEVLGIMLDHFDIDVNRFNKETALIESKGIFPNIVQHRFTSMSKLLNTSAESHFPFHHPPCTIFTL